MLSFITYMASGKLGSGAFAVVKLATNKLTGENFAVKCFNRRSMSSDDEEYLRQEMLVLKSCDHPNIVKYYAFYEESKVFFLVMELMEGGELLDRIIKKSNYNEMEARDAIFQVLSAINYCHDLGIIHRDLKPENLLLKSLSSDTGKKLSGRLPFLSYLPIYCLTFVRGQDIKVADFGFATTTEVNVCTLSSPCGSPGYTAPEILKHEHYGAPCDMWSIGVILFILISGKLPFHSPNCRILNTKVREGRWEFDPEHWDHVSADAKDLIRQLLNLDPQRRITAREALRHPWVTEHPHVLQSRSLDVNLDHIKDFKARPKFKEAVHAVCAVQRLKSKSVSVLGNGHRNGYNNGNGSNAITSESPSYRSREVDDVSLDMDGGQEDFVRGDATGSRTHSPLLSIAGQSYS